MKAIILLLSSLGLLGSAHFDESKPEEWRSQVTVLSARLGLLASKLDKSSTAVLDSCKVAMVTLFEMLEKYKRRLQAAEAELKKVECQNLYLERASDIGTVEVDFETMEEFMGGEAALDWFSRFAEELLNER